MADRIGAAYADLEAALVSYPREAAGRGSVSAHGAYCGRDIGGANVADILDASFCAPRRGLLLDETHGARLSTVGDGRYAPAPGGTTGGGCGCARK